MPTTKVSSSSTATGGGEAPGRKGPQGRRRGRYERNSRPVHRLTPTKLAVLQLLAQSRYLTTEQAAAVGGFSPKAARGHLRDLFDLGLAERMAIPGAVLGRRALLDHDLHFVTRDGYRKLVDFGLLAKVPETIAAPRLTTLPHEFAVRDALVWLARSARFNPGDAVEQWDCTSALALGDIVMDAWFVYRQAGRGVVVGFVEADLGTERAMAGSKSDRWGVKIEAYGRAFADADRAEVKAFTGGHAHARLVVTVPSVERAHWVLSRLRGTVAGQYAWVVLQEALANTDAYAPVWARLSGWEQPFLPKGGQP